MIEIRKAIEQDIPAIREVAISAYYDTFSLYNTPENMQAFFDSTYNLPILYQELEEPNTWLYLAAERGKILGFARLRENREVADMLGPNTIELQRLYVLTEAQGRSVGTLLMEKSLDLAISRNYEWMWLGVWERNYNAQRFYKRVGFEKFSEHTFWMGDDPQIDWLLKKKL